MDDAGAKTPHSPEQNGAKPDSSTLGAKDGRNWRESVRSIFGSSNTPDEKSAEQKTSRRSLPRRATQIGAVPFNSTHYVPHKYFIRRPRPLQVEYQGRVVQLGDSGRLDVEGIEAQMSQDISQVTSNDNGEEESLKWAQERSTDRVDRQRERLDLFIDLIWVGIISNISEHYFEQAFTDGGLSPGRALVEFIVLFLPGWMIWVKLQLFLNAYFMDDLIQRIVVYWILALGMAWGNAAPFVLAEEDPESSSRLIFLYLIAINSLLLVEFVYGLWLPWLRRLFLIGFLLAIPGTALWIAAAFTNRWLQLGLVWAAIAYDRVSSTFYNSPLGDRFLGHGVRKAIDQKHMRKRYENFFIIALGEGLFLLVRGSPLGKGLTVQLSRGILALNIYYALHVIYFNGDQSKTNVHPVHRRWWIRAMWQFIHVILFAALVLLSSGVLYLVDYTPEEETNGVEAHGIEKRSAEFEISTSSETLLAAITTCYLSLATVLAIDLVCAVLHKPLDPPSTLVIDNRYIRLAPRAASVVVLSTMWLGFDTPEPSGALGYMALICWSVLLWEGAVSMEKGGGFIEPKEEAYGGQPVAH